ncbi:hypothetical protein ES705_40471 [subsurface metagenome]
MINELKIKFGKKCSGININGTVSKINIPSKQMKLCEALNYSFNVPIQMNKNNLDCPGARRSIGYDKDNYKLAKTISRKNGIPVSFITDALSNIPAFKDDVNHVNLGITEEMEEILPPDLFIMYVQPSKITEIMHLLAKQKIQPSIPDYSLLSICGNVFANCYINQLLSISFGCPESRKNGGVDDNEVIVGIPYPYAKYLTA